MRQLLPLPAADVEATEVVPAALYGRDRTPPGERPWVMANVVASVDGSAAVDGRTRALSGPADRALFRRLRSQADVVLVGAGTVRAEGYGPVRDEKPAPIAVVSRSLDLDWDGALFTEAAVPTLVVTCPGADPARRARAEQAAELVVAGDQWVDVGEAVTQLGRRGHDVVLCEGGPCLLGELVVADLLDELCLTLSPLVAGGAGPRIVTGAVVPAPRPLRLASVLEDDGNLFLRYLRD
ncbi:MAG: pyrimidine reductase family protein [Actinomycetota bacterium]|nr:pyrimidine reductase family protein [Actinomycetota bacterium]